MHEAFAKKEIAKKSDKSKSTKKNVEAKMSAVTLEKPTVSLKEYSVAQ